MKKLGFALLPVAAMVGLLLLSAPVLAKDCPQCGKGKSEGSLEEKFMDKAHMILGNSTALGLSEAQEKVIRELKLNTKKSLIRQDAEIDLVGADIKSKLYEDKIDLTAVNQLVDKKYELKKVRAKVIVEALSTLKAQLSANQMKKLKDLYQAEK